MHSDVHRLRQASFQAGTWCVLVHTALWHASVHASTAAPRMRAAVSTTRRCRILQHHAGHAQSSRRLIGVLMMRQQPGRHLPRRRR